MGEAAAPRLLATITIPVHVQVSGVLLHSAATINCSSRVRSRTDGLAAVGKIQAQTPFRSSFERACTESLVAMERRSDVHLATSSSSKLSRVLLSSFYPPISLPSDHPECLVPYHYLLTGPKSLRSLSSSLSLVSRLFAQICIPRYRVGNASVSSPLPCVDGFATMNVMPSANPASWFFSKHTAHAS